MRFEQVDRVIEDTQIKIGRQCLVIGIDLDGTLCRGEAWNCGDKVEPDLEMIEYVNNLSFNHFIIIHTARRRELMKETFEWLEKNNVRYHAIHFEKMPADVYLDDKAVRI